MDGLLIGYARVSTEEQDLTAQRDGLARLGVEPSRIYVDHGLTGTNRDRPRAARSTGRLPGRIGAAALDDRTSSLCAEQPARPAMPACRAWAAGGAVAPRCGPTTAGNARRACCCA